MVPWRWGDYTRAGMTETQMLGGINVDGGQRWAQGDLRMKHAWVSGLDPENRAVRCVTFWTPRGKVAKMDLV